MAAEQHLMPSSLNTWHSEPSLVCTDGGFEASSEPTAVPKHRGAQIWHQREQARGEPAVSGLPTSTPRGLCRGLSHSFWDLKLAWFQRWRAARPRELGAEAPAERCFSWGCWAQPWAPLGCR